MYLIDLLPKLLSSELNVNGFLFGFTDNFLFDILFVTNSYSRPLLIPIWYLSAMFIAFPLFTWLVQILDRYLVMVVSALFTLLCFGVVYSSNYIGIKSIIRTIYGLCLGAFIYEFVYVFNNYLNKANKIITTLIEIIMFLLPIIITYKNFTSYRFIVFCFTVCLAIMLPNLSYTSKIKGKVFIYLGKLSMPIFIIHWFIGTLISKFIMNNTTKPILYYAITIIVSMIATYLVDHWKWFQNINKKTIVLKD